MIRYHHRLPYGVKHEKAPAPYMAYTFRVRSVTMRRERYDITAHWATLFDTAYKVACTKRRECRRREMEGSYRWTFRDGKRDIDP
jgi:hypothetical protein